MDIIYIFIHNLSIYQKFNDARAHTRKVFYTWTRFWTLASPPPGFSRQDTESCFVKQAELRTLRANPGAVSRGMMVHMKVVVEKLLEDVDDDIREMMMADAELQPSPYMPMGGMEGALAMMPPRTLPYKNWELVPDPLFFIIQWQDMRSEKKLRRSGA